MSDFNSRVLVAIKADDLAEVESILAEAVEQAKQNQTPVKIHLANCLEAAIERDHRAIVSFLFYDKMAHHGGAVRAACKGGHQHWFEFFYPLRSVHNWEHYIYAAIETDQLEMLQYLIDRAPQEDGRIPEYAAMLEQAYEMCSSKIVAWLEADAADTTSDDDTTIADTHDPYDTVANFQL